MNKAQFIMHAEEITLTNGEVLKNKNIFIYERFLVIEAEKGANWINLDLVESMQGVIIKGRANQGRLG